MPPKKWGTTVNKSYAKPAGSIAAELAREPELVTNRIDQSTTAAAARQATPQPQPKPSAGNALQQDRNRTLLESDIRSAIRKKISASNLLGLPDHEIDGMVDLILAATSKKEVFDWCSTLMLEEKDAIEIISMREANKVGAFGGSAAVGGATPAAATTTNTPPAASQLQQNGSDAKLPSLQSVNQQLHPPKHSSEGPKVLNIGKSGNVVNTNGPEGGAVGGNKKRGANNKALANISQMGSSSLVVGKFFNCGCFASTHSFISNCLNCGRIFCEQEMPAKAAAVGSFAAKAGGITTESIMCYACGQDPNRNMSFDIKVQQGLVDSLAANKAQKGYEEAVGRRDQLLQFARERSKRTVVVDDQGVGGIAYGTNTTWMTEDEVAAMEDAERKRQVADMHKHTGAYRIHLDIVNKAVYLGATPVPDSNAALPETANSVPAAESATAAAAASKDNAWGTVPSAVPQNGPTDADDIESDDDDEGGRRVLPLPTLLQKLWYTADESEEGAKSKAHNGAGNWDARVTSEGTNASTLAKEGPTVLDLKPPSHRGMAVSARVQNDYFQDDDIAYRVEREDFIFKTKKALASGANKEKPTNGPVANRETFAQHGVGVSDSDIGSSNAIGAAMAAGGRGDDQGMCMSLHQPWASLLVAGIKIHEGRSWPSDFKGRLWIHAAAAKYSENEIEAIEEQHRRFLKANNMTDRKFPKSYPTSCLLGYVNVTEVIPVDEYNKRIPDPELRQEVGESGYMFMCEKGSKMLPFTLPMEGKHKIYKLERKLWGAARKQFGEE